MLKLRLGLPKGSLQDATFSMFKKAGYEFQVDSRSYAPAVDDDELEPLLLRPQEIPRYIEAGILDAGLTGKDWIVDNGSDVIEVAKLVYAKRTRKPIRVVLAAQNGSDINCVKDLQGKRISTEYVRMTERWLGDNGVEADVEFSWGACEAKVPDLADAIVVNVETGSSLVAHNLRIVEVLLESCTMFVANKDAWADDWKRQKIENLAMLLTGALNAQGLVGLKMNVPRTALAEVTKTLPALKKPTLSPLSDEDWVAVETVIEEKVVRDLIPKLRRAGAQGIVEYPLNKVIY
ncbi:MAG: ATP phosphoribosyltransferase [Armatimonadota bacterium]|nr:ATP phosphoribosyltransferase [Armatimonadota bacterium]